MGNSQSNRHSEDLSSPGNSGTTANSNIRGDRSGNTDSNNISRNTITINYNRGDPAPSRDQAEIMQCLYTSKYREHRRRVREPAEGTCTWVTEHPKYKEWLGKENSGLLWLSADPGYGKSVTASFLVKHLESETDAIIFKDDSDEQRSAARALCAILHQLFMRKNALCRYAEGEYKGRGRGITEEIETLWDILVKAVAEGGCGNVICVVDALDECDEGTLAQLAHHVTGLPGPQTPDIPLKFLVTSRPYHKIEKQLGSPATTIRLKGEEEVPAITADVTRVIDAGIRDLESYWEQPGELGYLRNLLEAAADRTFLWVSLVLEILKNSEDGSPEVFTNIVSTAPPDIAQLYSKILDKTTDPDKARRILSIVVAAARPLTLQEMNIAFRIRREHKSSQNIWGQAGLGKAVKHLCGLFVRVIDSKIYLVHQTAREFLLQGSTPGVGNWQYTLCLKDSNFILADICITYLLLEDFENDPFVELDDSNLNRENINRYLKKYHFLDYAARNWAGHFKDLQDKQMGLSQFTRLICKAGSKRFLTWFRVYCFTVGRQGTCLEDFTNLMVASWLGQEAVVQQLLGEGGNINARCKVYGTALNIAAIRKNENITRMLLEKNVKAYIGGNEYNILHTNRKELESLDYSRYFYIKSRVWIYL